MRARSCEGVNNEQKDRLFDRVDIGLGPTAVDASPQCQFPQKIDIGIALILVLQTVLEYPAHAQHLFPCIMAHDRIAWVSEYSAPERIEGRPY